MKSPPRRIHLDSLRLAAADSPPGYLEEVTAAGRIEGDFLIIEERSHRRLRRKYSPIRWGDVAHFFARPVARLWDRLFGTRLEHCRSCAERRRRWGSAR